MNYRALMVSAALATAMTGVAASSRADMVAVDNGIAVRDSGVATPARGMTMSQVASKFGDPSSKVAAVGTPPISRWEYPGFVVYFERDHVIHSVVLAAPPQPPAAKRPPLPPRAASEPGPSRRPRPPTAPPQRLPRTRSRKIRS